MVLVCFRGIFGGSLLLRGIGVGTVRRLVVERFIFNLLPVLVTLRRDLERAEPPRYRSGGCREGL